MFFGVIPFSALLSGLVAKHKKVWLYFLAGLICLFASFGEHTPFRWLLYEYFPLLDYFRFPAIFRGFTLFFWIIGAAHAFEQFEQNPKKYRTFLIMLLVLLLVVLIATHLSQYTWSEVMSIKRFFEPGTLQENRLMLAIIVCALTSIIGLIIVYFKRFSPLLNYLVIFEILVGFYLIRPTTITQANTGKTINDLLKKTDHDWPIPDLDAPVNTLAFHQPLFLTRIGNNASILLKTPSANGYSPYTLQSRLKADITTLQQMESKPFIYLSADTSATINIERFIPANLQLNVSIQNRDTLRIFQNQHRLFSATVNGIPARFISNSSNLLAIELDKGHNEVNILYNTPFSLRLAVWLSAALYVGVIVYLIWMQWRILTFPLALLLGLIIYFRNTDIDFNRTSRDRQIKLEPYPGLFNTVSNNADSKLEKVILYKISATQSSTEFNAVTEINHQLLDEGSVLVLNCECDTSITKQTITPVLEFDYLGSHYWFGQTINNSNLSHSVFNIVPIDYKPDILKGTKAYLWTPNGLNSSCRFQIELIKRKALLE